MPATYPAHSRYAGRSSCILPDAPYIIVSACPVAQAMKQYKDEKGTRRVLDHRQLGLKLIANVVCHATQRGPLARHASPVCSYTVWLIMSFESLYIF
jgi:hypothetical protein